MTHRISPIVTKPIPSPENLPPSERRPGRRRAIARARGNRTGAYTVEFAVCATVFFVVIFACFELSRYMYVMQAVDQVAYEAARTGVVIGADAAAVRDRAEQLLSAYGIAAAEIEVAPSVIDQTTTAVTVSIRCDFSENSWATPDFVSATEITTTVTLDHENQAYLISEDATNNDNLQSNDEPLDT